ncbi:hypothetical protein B0H11DRAFT_2272488 [Mycena galericulata]|nr:hypothetical protein B0H11DRAFT_2272488 [Mycena galericulata]
MDFDEDPERARFWVRASAPLGWALAERYQISSQCDLQGWLREAHRGSTAMCANESSVRMQGRHVNPDAMICYVGDEMVFDSIRSRNNH